MNPNMKIFHMLFPGGLDRALTLSYDDGVVQDRRLSELCRSRGVKCTFNLNSGTLGRVETATAPGREPLDISCVTSEELQTVYAGHEVAAHGLWHSSLPDLGTPGAMYEIITDRVNLEKLSGGAVQSFAYPFGTFNADVKTLLRLAGFRSARTVRSTGAFALPGDFLEWDPTCHHDDPRLMELFETFCDDAAPRFGGPQLFYLWGHAYEFDARHNWDVIERFLDRAAPLGGKVWFAANGEIVRYTEAYRALVWSADGGAVTNPTTTALWIGVGREGTVEVPAGATVQLV
jgi:hypothetical protein